MHNAGLSFKQAFILYTTLQSVSKFWIVKTSFLLVLFLLKPCPQKMESEQRGRCCIHIFELCLKKISFHHNFSLFLESSFLLMKDIIALIYI